MPGRERLPDQGRGPPREEDRVRIPASGRPLHVQANRRRLHGQGPPGVPLQGEEEL